MKAKLSYMPAARVRSCIVVLLIAYAYMHIFSGTPHAQSGGIHDLSHAVVSGGGGSSSGMFGDRTLAVTGSVGQGLAGTESGDLIGNEARFSLRGGFWISPRFAPTAASVPIGGRVLDAGGRAIPGVLVMVSSLSGEVLSALSNSFGYYTVENVHVGQTYVIDARSREFMFVPIALVVDDPISNLDLKALP